MHNLLAARLPPVGPIPLCWVTAGLKTPYLNLGDALSAVIVAGMAMRTVKHVPMRHSTLRMSAVGTIGHSLIGGEAVVWGTGTSSYSNPLAGPDRILYTPPPDTKLVVTSTRGPISRRILGEQNGVGAGGYGDPVWLLPRMFAPKVEKRYDLGVIIHLSDLADRGFEANPKSDARRYDIPDSLSGSIKLINTVTPVSLDGLRERIEMILSCRRIVSTSLHGMVIAETYGIPCLYYSPRGRAVEVQMSKLDETQIDLRLADFYRGVGRTELPIFVQPRDKQPDWDGLVSAIDRNWQQITDYDDQPLIDAFPLPVLGIDGKKDLFERDCVRAIDFDPSHAKRLRGAAVESLRSLPSKAWRRITGRS